MRSADEKPIRSTKATIATGGSSNSFLNQKNKESRCREKEGKVKLESGSESSGKLELQEQSSSCRTRKVGTGECDERTVESVEERRVTRSMRKGVDVSAAMDNGALLLASMESDARPFSDSERYRRKANNSVAGEICGGKGTANDDSVSFEEAKLDGDCEERLFDLNASVSEAADDNNRPDSEAQFTKANANSGNKSVSSADNEKVTAKNMAIHKKRKGRRVMKKSKKNRGRHSKATANSIGGSTNNGSGGGSSSRMAKLSWSKFDSYFRRIPMGTRKDIILKTIPINSIQRRFIVQELTNLEKTLFVDPSWGKIAKKGGNGSYVNKLRLSLPPIYLKGCSLDSIVDIVSRSILRSSRTGNTNSKPCVEINKPYFVLFELQNYLYLVSLEAKSFDLVDSKNNQIQNENSAESLAKPDAACCISNEIPDGSLFNTKEEMNSDPDDNDEFNVKWDILGVQELSYYQFRYVERYLHDVFYNYDHSHKKFERIINKSLPDEFSKNGDPGGGEEGISSSLFDDKIELEEMVTEYVHKANEIGIDCSSGRSSASLSVDLNSDDVAARKERELINTGSQSLTIGGGSSHLFLSETGGGRSSWGSYRSYDPIYWWVDFVLPALSGEDLVNIVGGKTIRFCDIRRVYLQNNGLNDSYIEPPNCIYLGNMYWLDPCKPIKVVKRINTLCGGESNSGADNNVKNNSNVDFTSADNTANTRVETVLIHPYMMNQFKENPDFNF
ncbi:hypothetical protein FG386_000261, partial [Cryptosporidium ryanae]|uniref:uncharacterized protein n=1 Tax=Cryptosporidium ryanae TaxID=515981 RepID=UPI00351A0527